MFELLWLVPALPLAGFLLLGPWGFYLSRRLVALVGVGSVAVAAALALAMGAAFLASPPPGYSYSQTLWTWLELGTWSASVTLRLDPLSLVMMLVIAGVGALIHLYSVEYMAEDEGYSRFFAYLNLFVAAMLTLVLADNLLLLLLGWEGVGLCSFLLIGFWYRDAANARAARKAFIVTRVGDTAMIVGLLLLLATLGTLGIQDLLAGAEQNWAVGSPLAVAAAALLLAGALGKSAQLPLQVWLPDAMAGPTPVSALIHAATMVTAGVYLIARTNVIFALAPPVQLAVALIGAATLLIAGFSALAQSDIKRVLAYSTISQIGYMFLALGVGAWAAGIFHFVTHAFFKALLFLAAGVVILSLHHEQNIFRMGGLRRALPLTFWAFLAGVASLAALPLLTAGFYSKDMILFEVWASRLGGPWLWAAGLGGALLTSLYAFRLLFVVFWGERHAEPVRVPGPWLQAPLVVLAALSIVGGFVEMPRTLGGVPALSNFLDPILPHPPLTEVGLGAEAALQAVAGLAALLGVAIAYYLYVVRPTAARRWAEAGAGGALHRLWFAGWGFDWLYERLLVRPFLALARAASGDPVDLAYRGVAWAAAAAHGALSATQTGKVRWYAAGLGLGAVVLIGIGVLS